VSQLVNKFLFLYAEELLSTVITKILGSNMGCVVRPGFTRK